METQRQPSWTGTTLDHPLLHQVADCQRRGLFSSVQVVLKLSSSSCRPLRTLSKFGILRGLVECLLGVHVFVLGITASQAEATAGMLVSRTVPCASSIVPAVSGMNPSQACRMLKS